MEEEKCVQLIQTNVWPWRMGDDDKLKTNGNNRVVASRGQPKNEYTKFSSSKKCSAEIRLAKKKTFGCDASSAVDTRHTSFANTNKYLAFIM